MHRHRPLEYRCCRLQTSSESGRRSFYPAITPRCAAPSPSPAWRRASRRALRCGQPVCSGQWRRRHGSGELPCMQRQFLAASLLTALAAMFPQQTFASVGKVLPAVIAALVLAELDADPAWVGVYYGLAAAASLVAAGAPEEKVRFAPDSPLEGARFEPSVPPSTLSGSGDLLPEATTPDTALLSAPCWSRRQSRLSAKPARHRLAVTPTHG
jgi:hypothetical protein